MLVAASLWFLPPDEKLKAAHHNYTAFEERVKSKNRGQERFRPMNLRCAAVFTTFCSPRAALLAKPILYKRTKYR